MNKEFNIGCINLNAEKVLDTQPKLRGMDLLLANLPTLDFVELGSGIDQVQQGLPIESTRTEERFIEVRTSKASCMQFNDVDKAKQWIAEMQTKYGKACPTYNLYAVLKTTKATRIS